MKKQIILLLASCLSIAAHAQTGPRFVGVTSEGGVNGAGTIIQYTGGATSIALWASLITGNPQSSHLTETPNGKLYGPVDDGGPKSFDAIIEYDYATNSYKVVASFDSATGSIPGGSLLLLGDSTFYGLAYYGGANNSGTIFSYTIGSSIITRLADLPPSAYPYGSLIQAADSKLYGMTQDDGIHKSGTLFSFDISSKAYTPLINFPTYAHPLGSLLEVGIDTLYGMTYNDSLKHNGYIFQYITTQGTLNILHYFTGGNTFAEGSLIRASDGLLYGMTTNGGIYSSGLYSGGQLFAYNPRADTFSVLHNFGNGTDGAYPLGDVYQGSDGILYGMTNEGGTSNKGTIFQYDIATHTYALNVNLSAATGYFPGFGHLTEYEAVPVIYSQPSAITACTDSIATFTVGDSGTNVKVQWQVSVNSGINFSNISGATSNSYSFVASSVQNGYLYRTVLTGFGRPDTSDSALLTVKSICYPAATSNIEASTFSLYPSPTTGSFAIEQNYTRNLTVQILNLPGQKLKEFKMKGPRGQFDISDLAAGIYEVQITDGVQIQKVLKVVKE